MYRVWWGELRLYTGAFFGARHSCWGLVFWIGLGPRTPRTFSPGSFSSGFRCFFALSLPLLLLLLSGGRPGCLFLFFFRSSCRTMADSRYQYRPESMQAHRFPPSLLLLPSLSLSSLCEHAQRSDHSEPG